jgi:hypothetical protein
MRFANWCTGARRGRGISSTWNDLSWPVLPASISGAVDGADKELSNRFQVATGENMRKFVVVAAVALGFVDKGYPEQC